MKEFILKNKLLLASILAIISLFFLNKWNYNRWQEAKEEIVRNEANIAALQDTIRVTKAKDGTVQYNKLSFIAKDLAELKKVNEDLAREVEITKGKVAAIQKIGFEIKHDTLEVPVYVKVIDSTIYMAAKYDTTFSGGNFRSLKLESSYSLLTKQARSVLTEDRIGFTATVGIARKDTKSYEIFVRPHYPNMQVVGLEGAIIENNFFKDTKKQKAPLVTIGGTLGWTPITYDIKAKKGDLNLNRIGGTLGIQFNLIR